MKGWVLDDALALIRKLAERLAPQYHLALAGSVLLRGQSRNDLDLIVYPASSEAQDKDFVAKVLTEEGLKRLHDREVVHRAWRRRGSDDAKHVEVWEYKDRKLDVFFLS